VCFFSRVPWSPNDLRTYFPFHIVTPLDVHPNFGTPFFSYFPPTPDLFLPVKPTWPLGARVAHFSLPLTRAPSLDTPPARSFLPVQQIPPHFIIPNNPTSPKFPPPRIDPYLSLPLLFLWFLHSVLSVLPVRVILHLANFFFW